MATGEVSIAGGPQCRSHPAVRGAADDRSDAVDGRVDVVRQPDPPGRAPAKETRRAAHRVWEGLSFVLRQPLLRRIVLCLPETVSFSSNLLTSA
jgi:hypothetical protein